MRILTLIFLLAVAISAQMPSIEPGVSHELAKWRAARYSDVRYKLNLTLEKMSPVVKGTMEIRVKVGTRTLLSAGDVPPIILDWRKIRGSESLSTISNISINGVAIGARTLLSASPQNEGSQVVPNVGDTQQIPLTDRSVRVPFEERDEHVIFRDGAVEGENVIKLDFTSPILTSGSAITRYVDKEDGAEYIYSLFVPSDASTAFPVFDQPDLKARFTLEVTAPTGWSVVSNSELRTQDNLTSVLKLPEKYSVTNVFPETKPISTYVFAFAAGPFEAVNDAGTGGNASVNERALNDQTGRPNTAQPNIGASPADGTLVNTRVSARVFVRRSQAAKFKPHAAEVFRLNREGIKFLEQYFDYKFPFPKYDIVLIPEFPFGGMEHAGATFLREASVIFPQEPTKNDYISRANLIFHEAAHQWFGDTVTMKWFDDLWLKEGFAEFMAYKTLEKVMPEYNAWKVFYERNKQAAYLTDSTKGTTPIYQEIANLNSAKSAYGNIVYRKAPSFLRQAEFYLGPDKFQTAVRSFLKKHEYANAGWEDLVKEFEGASELNLKNWAKQWVQTPGLPVIRTSDLRFGGGCFGYRLLQSPASVEIGKWSMVLKPLVRFSSGPSWNREASFTDGAYAISVCDAGSTVELLFPNARDYGYGIFLLDDKSRDYVLKNIGSEKDDFLRTMMWGSLWDSVREGELDPKEYVELVLRVQSSSFSLPSAAKKQAKAWTLNETDESTIQTLLSRVSTALNYYVSDAERTALAPKVEALLIDKMQNASTPGQKITYYRAFLNIASSENGRRIMKVILKGGNPSGSEGAPSGKSSALPTSRVSGTKNVPVLRNATASTVKPSQTTKDRFDIVSKLILLGDPEAPKLLADLEKTETSDEAKRYAYAAKAGFATAENKAKFWADFVSNKDISESWIEAAFGPFNNVRHSTLTLPYLEKALAELPNLKRSRKIFFVNGWLGAFIGGQKSEAALAIVNKFLADNPNLDKDLRLKILENVDLIERAVRISGRFGKS